MKYSIRQALKMLHVSCTFQLLWPCQSLSAACFCHSRDGYIMEFTSEASLTRVCNTNYVSLLSPIASAPCVTSVLRSLPALAAQATSNRNWGPCDESLSVQDFPTFINYSKTFWGLPVTTFIPNSDQTSTPKCRSLKFGSTKLRPHFVQIMIISS